MRNLTTPRELELLRHVARTGDTIPKAGIALNMSTQPSKNHLQAAYKSLGVHSMTGAFIVLGWLKAPKEKTYYEL